MLNILVSKSISVKILVLKIIVFKLLLLQISVLKCICVKNITVYIVVLQNYPPRSNPKLSVYAQEIHGIDRCISIWYLYN